MVPDEVGDSGWDQVVQGFLWPGEDYRSSPHSNGKPLKGGRQGGDTQGTMMKPKRKAMMPQARGVAAQTENVEFFNVT